MEFAAFPKIPRWSAQNMIITEKIDGTNAQIAISDDLTEIKAGSRNRWITPDDDNFGFARWVDANKEHLLQLGKGVHFGEWWGQGIQRCYNKKEKVFSLFNTARWAAADQQDRLKAIREKVAVEVTPILYQGEFSDEAIQKSLKDLETEGSRAAPGFQNPEGVIIFLPGPRTLFKYTIGGNNPKG